jgi:hypothetical protein
MQFCGRQEETSQHGIDLITFSGIVTDFTNGQPITSQAIKVILKQNSCLICSALNVAAAVQVPMEILNSKRKWRLFL